MSEQQEKNITEMLRAKFPYDDIEFRISRVFFEKKKATVLAYIDSRAVMDRLDEVFGLDGWQDSYQFIGKDVACTLHVKINGEWVKKMDGASQTNFESFKGGISNALKRTAVKLGIGRYLYGLPEILVDIYLKKPKNVNPKYVHYEYNKAENTAFWWISPGLPNWALPEDPEKKMPQVEQQETEHQEKDSFFEIFKEEMRKLYKELGKEEFFARLRRLGYEQINDLENKDTQTLGKILKEMAL